MRYRSFRFTTDTGKNVNAKGDPHRCHKPRLCDGCGTLIGYGETVWSVNAFARYSLCAICAERAVRTGAA